MLHTGATPGPDPQPATAQDYVRLLSLAFRGTGAIPRLLRVKLQHAAAQPDQINESIAAALDELSKEWGIDL